VHRGRQGNYCARVEILRAAGRQSA
jgi:hypothetical protein